MSSLRSFLVLFLVALSMTVQAAPVAQATNTADIGNITDIESNSSESHASDGSQSTATGKSEGPKEDGGDALANIIAPVANGDVRLFEISMHSLASRRTMTDINCI